MDRTEIFFTPPSETQRYADAVVANGVVYTTGQMPLDSDWNLISEDFNEQVEYVFDRLFQVLDQSGASINSLIKVTIYLADITDTALLSPHRKRLLGDVRPASVIVQTGGFEVRGMRLEAEAIALIDQP